MLTKRREPFDFDYDGKACSCCPLTEEEIEAAHRLAEAYGGRLRLPGSAELGEMLAEYGAIASVTLRDREGGKVFADPMEALGKLTIDELSAVYDACCLAQGLAQLGAWDDEEEYD